MIIPEEGIVRAPFDATVAALFPTNHAICLEGTNGVEMMIHIGIDTVKMDGKGFQSFVSQDDVVKAGDKLIAFDMNAIREAGYSEQTMVIITNTDDFSDVSVDAGKKTDGTDKPIHISK